MMPWAACSAHCAEPSPNHGGVSRHRLAAHSPPQTYRHDEDQQHMIRPKLTTMSRPFHSRRTILKGGLIAGAGLMGALPWIGGTKADLPALTKYVGRLTVPPVAQPSHIDDGIAHYRIEMAQFQRKVHPDLRGPTTLWGYDGTWPGP